MKMHTCFPNSILNNDGKNLYSQLYGDDVAELFTKTIETSPEEMAIISRMLCFLALNLRKEN